MFDNSFDKDENCIEYALMMWANYIETGDVLLNQNVIIDMIKAIPDDDYHKSELRDVKDKLKNLSNDQKAFVIRLRNLAKYIRDGNTRLN